MDAVQFVRMAVEDIHRGFSFEVEPLTLEQMLYRPTDKTNTIAFLLWHAARSEDVYIHRHIQGEAPLWEIEGWHERFGLDAGEGGTGFTDKQVGAFRPPKEDLMAYCQRVWEIVPGMLSELTEQDLDKVPNPDRPKMNIGRMLGNFVLGHSFWHLGDIRFLKGLQGLPFRA